jgi:hypothetical protein
VLGGASENTFSFWGSRQLGITRGSQMKKTLQMLLLALGFALLSSAAGADEVPFQNELEDQSGVTGLNPFDTFIGPYVQEIDEIFDAFPDIRPSFTVTEDRFDVFFDCSLFVSPCITSLRNGQGEGFSILGSLTDLFPVAGPFQGRPDFTPFNPTHTVEFTFRALEPSGPENVPEPNTLLLMGTGLLVLVRLVRRKDWSTTLPPSV